MVLRTSAKVNLALEVLGRRPDGYHELSTVLQAVDLFDRLTVETAEAITLETSDPALPTDDGNLVVRAARLLRETAGVETGARIVLDKRIPVAAGLGGLGREDEQRPLHPRSVITKFETAGGASRA